MPKNSTHLFLDSNIKKCDSKYNLIKRGKWGLEALRKHYGAAASSKKEKEKGSRRYITPLKIVM